MACYVESGTDGLHFKVDWNVFKWGKKINAFICDFETYQLKCHVVLYHGNRS